MDNEQGRKFGTTGPLVRVKWNDAAAQIKIHVINGNEPEEHLAKCETVGELIIDDPKVLILCQHWSDRNEWIGSKNCRNVNPDTFVIGVQSPDPYKMAV